MLCKENTGSILTSTTEAIYAPSTIFAESLAIRLAVKLAHNLNMEDVIVESDWLPAVEACSGNIKWIDLQTIINDIHKIKAQIWNWGFTWTGRDGNCVAHEIAQLTSTNQLPSN